MRGVCLRGANLNHCRLIETDFRGGVMLDVGRSSPVGLEITDLSECLVEYASATRAQLSGVDLSGASLVGADLSGAVLFGANLSDADLSYCSLGGANLSDARLGKTKFIGAASLERG